jgi:hypothetical protein
LSPLLLLLLLCVHVRVCNYLFLSIISFSSLLSLWSGILTLGGVDQSLHKKHEKVQYASLVPRSEFWSVEIAAIRLGDDKVNDDFSRINKGGALFDSGSTDSVFPAFIKTLFTQVVGN